MDERTIYIKVPKQLYADYKYWLAIKGKSMKQDLVEMIKEKIYKEGEKWNGK